MNGTAEEPNNKERIPLPWFKPWREIAVAATIFMELSWVVLWYRVAIPAGREATYIEAFSILAAMLFLFYVPSRVMKFLDTNLLVRRSLILILLVINIIVGIRALLYIHEPLTLVELLNRPVRSFADMAKLIPPEFTVMLFAVFVGWRGIVHSDSHVGPVSVLASFRFGILMFFFFGLIMPLTNTSPYLALYIFIFSSLLAMSSARIAVLSQLRGGLNIQFNRQWMLGIIAVIFGIVGISAVLVTFARQRLFDTLSMLLTGLIYLVALIFSPLLYLLTRLLIWFFEAIRIDAFFNALREIFNRLQKIIQSFVSLIDDWANELNIEAFQDLLTRIAGYKPIYLWLILALAAAVVLLSLRRRLFKEERRDDQDSQSSRTEQSLMRYLKSVLRRGLDRLSENIEELLRLRQARRLLAAARIRRIYARLLHLSARLDRPRPAARTPLEFLPALKALFPDQYGELETITHAYLLVRYGELPEADVELEHVEAAWRRVSTAGVNLLKARRRASRGGMDLIR